MMKFIILIGRLTMNVKSVVRYLEHSQFYKETLVVVHKFSLPKSSRFQYPKN